MYANHCQTQEHCKPGQAGHMVISHLVLTEKEYTGHWLSEDKLQPAKYIRTQTHG